MKWGYSLTTLTASITYLEKDSLENLTDETLSVGCLAVLFVLMGERRGLFPHRRISTLYSAFMEEFLKLFYWWNSRLVLFVFIGERRGPLISSQTNLILYSNQGKGQVGA